ncbi:succinyl-diaminopimelate desuccinylase [Agromyces sp. ISL-38]|uniref:succinyl-diaminopimelate desuccinylase n=1 Tax=Agromyces sp. ISL-38 TaxID=2819107 RepID=UPI001BEC1F35|nr:succinyl-diaminopimelate desuccinylase [Agromyces sp. ISL-38]MBT2498905.1 succinyl-diaminopimelate desuccinylase [Agromyces sp. ISL-38]MBT2516409.1 succinyl-diaminopimelate desuccinylase [Streptomyces sp. ISL-90]
MSTPAAARPALDLTADSVAITQAICDVPSVSGHETLLADLIVDALAAASHLEIVRDGDTIVARTNLGRDRRVVIAGHLDTVPINENLPTRFETIDGQPFLWGRGTVDMKAGVAVQLKLALELVAPTVDVTWMWYDHEEVSAELNGLGRLARHRPDLFEGDFAILGEPSNGRVEGGCNGNLRVELRAYGLRAHSARSWVGENAIHKLVPALDRLAAYEAATIDVDGLAYREGLNAVGITGGIAGNVIPDEAMLHVNYRFAPSRTVAEAIDLMREMFPEYELTVVDQAEGARPGLDAPLAQQFVRAVGGEARPKYGWTDVARFSALGIPAVNYGPGDPLKAHADDERVDVDQILSCERALRAWLSGDV